MGVCLIGVSFEAKMQLGLLVILSFSLVNYLVGTLLPLNQLQLSRGVTGYSRQLDHSFLSWPFEMARISRDDLGVGEVTPGIGREKR